MLLPKAMYFVNTCSAVPWGRYKVIYFSTLGFTGAQIGTIRSGTHFAKLVAWPLWGLLSDQVQSLRFSLILSLCLATLALETMRSVGDCPYIAPEYVVILAYAVLRSGMNAGWPLVDAATLALVQRQHRHIDDKIESGDTNEHKEGYGRQRLWGAVAWGSCSLLVGVTIDYFGLSMVFWLTYAAVIIELGIVLAWLPSDLTVEASQENVVASPSNSGFSLRSWTSWKLVVFFVNLFLYSLVHAIPEQILILDMERNAASRTMQGAATAATVLLEIPIFYHSDKLLAAYGTRGMFIRAQIACILRFVLCYFVPRSAMYLMVPIQALHGLSYGLMWSAAIPYVQIIAPPGKETLAQSMVCTIWGTLGQAIGSLVWGALYDLYSPAEVYFSGAVLTLFILIFISLPSRNWLRTVEPTPLISCMRDPSFKMVPRLADLAENV